MITRPKDRHARTDSLDDAASCPRIRPGAQVGTSPFKMCRSVPQMVVVETLMMASVGLLISGSGRSSSAFLPGA